jgi:TATA-binding protein-associated factor Taf7
MAHQTCKGRQTEFQTTTKTMGRQLAVVAYWNTFKCTAAKNRRIRLLEEEEEKEDDDEEEEEEEEDDDEDEEEEDNDNDDDDDDDDDENSYYFQKIILDVPNRPTLYSYNTRIYSSILVLNLS